MNFPKRYRNFVLSMLLALLAFAPSQQAHLASAESDAAPEALCAPTSGSSSISGRVLTNGFLALPLQFISVRAYTTYGQYAGSSSTNASGIYTISNLIAADYIVEFKPGSGPYLSEWNGDQITPLTAPPIAVGLGVTVTGINALLAVGARLTGTVLSAPGVSVANASIDVFDASGSSVATGFLDTSGVYTTQPGLPNGLYRLRFTSSGYLEQYSGGKLTLSEAIPITVSTAGFVAVAPATLAKGATVTGRVSDAVTGLPISGVAVNGDGGYAYTNATGVYTISGLASGLAQISINPDDMSGFLAAQRSITVTAPGTTSNVDFALARGGAMTGRVTDSSGVGLKDITVNPFSGSGERFSAYTLTDAGGYYTVTGIPSTVLRVLFRPSDYINSEVAVTITAPLTTTNVNAVLTRGASISGIVTDEATGLPLKDIFVEAETQEDGRVETAFTNNAGRYVLTTTLPSGSYKVRFSTESRFATCAYVGEYNGDQFNFGAAPPITVTAPASYTVNAALTRGSIVLGKVTDATTGAPVTSGFVSSSSSTNNLQRSGRISFTGGYVFDTGLPSGTYMLKYSGNSNGYIDEFYNDKPSAALADPVTLSAPTNKPGVDFAVAKGGTLSGRVRAADTGLAFSGGYVVVYDALGSLAASSGIDDDGSYQVSQGLSSGAYRVAVLPYGERNIELLRAQQGGPFTPSGYLRTFYNNGAPITITAPSNTPSIDITMQRGAFLPLAAKR
jgi:hypothetical protein